MDRDPDSDYQPGPDSLTQLTLGSNPDRTSATRYPFVQIVIFCIFGDF
jgi:hypothetical protein